MKQLLLISAAALILSAWVKAKRAIKFGPALNIYYKAAGSGCRFITHIVHSSIAWTTGGVAIQATILTAGGSTIALFGTQTCGAYHEVHLHL